jgi:MFS family permease
LNETEPAALPDSPVFTGGFAVFKHRDFGLYICARFFSSIAAQMIIIAVGWQVYHLTGRVLDLGLFGLSQFLPFLCLSLFAGHAADVYDRRVIILLCLIAFLGCTRASCLCTNGSRQRDANFRGPGSSRRGA